jgi:hypothetical protein
LKEFDRKFIMLTFRGMLIKRAYPLEEIRRMAAEGDADRDHAGGFCGVREERVRHPSHTPIHRTMNLCDEWGTLRETQ